MPLEMVEVVSVKISKSDHDINFMVLVKMFDNSV